MGGEGSDMFKYFKILILQGLIAAKKHSEKLTSLVDVMRAGDQSFVNKAQDSLLFRNLAVNSFTITALDSAHTFSNK